MVGTERKDTGEAAHHEESLIQRRSLPRWGRIALTLWFVAPGIVLPWLLDLKWLCFVLSLFFLSLLPVTLYTWGCAEGAESKGIKDTKPMV